MIDGRRKTKQKQSSDNKSVLSFWASIILDFREMLDYSQHVRNHEFSLKQYISINTPPLLQYLHMIIKTLQQINLVK